MRESLLGYVLGALDDTEFDRVRGDVERSPQLKHEADRLRAHVHRLLPDRGEFSPPAGLAKRTCRAVQVAVERRAPTVGSQQRRTQLAGSVGNLSFADVAVAAGVVIAACLLFFPAIVHSRHQARLAVCQDHLRQLGTSLIDYSQRNSREQFPYVPPEGKLSAAGIYAPVLADGGWIDDHHTVVCPDCRLAEKADEFRIPSREELLSADAATLAAMRKMMGGSYGYNLGYLSGNYLHGTRNRSRSHFALMADAAYRDGDGVVSASHGPRAQNVLFEDGHVELLKQDLPDGADDEIYLNDRGRVEAGLHADDAVVAPSEAAPVRQPREVLCPQTVVFPQ